MKTFSKLVAGAYLVAIIGLVGCATKTETPAKTGSEAKSHSEEHGDHSHGEEKTKTEPMKVEPKAEEPKTETPPAPEEKDPVEAESGSGEKKGGVNVPE